MTHNIIEDLEKFESIALDIATTQHTPDMLEQYTTQRKKILSIAIVSDKLPNWATTCRNGNSFWAFIKDYAPKYACRRAFIRDSLLESILHVENMPSAPIYALDKLLPLSTSIFDSESILAAWNKGIERRSSDPDGAMTSARTILESLCKHILDEFNFDYRNEEDQSLQRLYSKVAKMLKLSADQHTEKEFKKILSGFYQVVDGLARIRGLAGDAHGTGKVKYKISERHAVLAINAAFTVIIFLADTYRDHKNSLAQ